MYISFALYHNQLVDRRMALATQSDISSVDFHCGVQFVILALRQAHVSLPNLRPDSLLYTGHWRLFLWGQKLEHQVDQSGLSTA